ncbi:DUF2281 domain-containing protein [Leptolyngbyaceae cyanobacterium UHCC 1019]
MTTETAILKNIEKLPESIKQSVLLYTSFLVSQYAEKKPEEAVSKTEIEKKYGYGSLAGKIFMSDNFDEPLEDLKDYM